MFINKQTIGNFLVVFFFVFMFSNMVFMQKTSKQLEALEEQGKQIEETLNAINASQTDLDFRIDETQSLILEAVASITGKPQGTREEWFARTEAPVLAAPEDE